MARVEAKQRKPLAARRKLIDCRDLITTGRCKYGHGRCQFNHNIAILHRDALHIFRNDKALQVPSAPKQGVMNRKKGEIPRAVMEKERRAYIMQRLPYRHVYALKDSITRDMEIYKHIQSFYESDPEAKALESMNKKPGQELVSSHHEYIDRAAEKLLKHYICRVTTKFEPEEYFANAPFIYHEFVDYVTQVKVFLPKGMSEIWVNAMQFKAEVMLLSEIIGGTEISCRKTIGEAMRDPMDMPLAEGPNTDEHIVGLTDDVEKLDDEFWERNWP